METINITVRFFAMLKGRVGRSELTLTIPENTSLGKLKEILKGQFPSIAELIDKKNIMFSVNQEFAINNTIIKEGDEVALLPPFSGG